MLPFDVQRCFPFKESDKCLSCKRYAKHPKQTYGSWTPMMSIPGSHSDKCMFISDEETVDDSVSK